MLSILCLAVITYIHVMSRKYKFSDQDKLYFVSFAVVYWIDLFIRKEYKDIITSSLAFCCKEKELELYGWCIMTSHVHLLLEQVVIQCKIL